MAGDYLLQLYMREDTFLLFPFTVKIEDYQNETLDTDTLSVKGLLHPDALLSTQSYSSGEASSIFGNALKQYRALIYAGNPHLEYASIAANAGNPLYSSPVEDYLGEQKYNIAHYIPGIRDSEGAPLYQGELLITLNVGKQYENQKLYILQNRDGKIERLEGVVKDGVLSFTTASLSPFAVVSGAKGGSGSSGDLPKTGDFTWQYPALCMATVLLIAASAMLLKRKYQ